LEALEDRLTPSTLTVLNNTDTGVKGDGSLRGEILAANSGDTIVFAPSVHAITLTSGALAVPTSLAIQGPGSAKLTISGHGASRVFDINSGVSVTLSGLTVTDGQAVTGGGIDNAGILTLNNCTLSANQSTGSATAPTETSPEGGGAILNEAGATLTLNHSTLTGNTANAFNNTVDVFGGGLLNQGSATVISCTISGNQATGGGGGSFFGGSVGGGLDNYGGATLTVTNSSFSDNQALGSGTGDFAMAGAIGNDAGLDVAHPSTAIISSSVFTENVAGGVAGVDGNGITAQGGALDNQGTGASMTVSSCTLRDNQAVGGSGSGGFAEGGCIINNGGSRLTVTNSSFKDNEALGGGSGTQGLGGAIENVAYSISSTTPETATINNCTFTGNVAGGVAGVSGFGGALNNAGPGATMTVSNSTLLNNQSVGGGGAGIDNASGATLTVTNSSFLDNKALGDQPQQFSSATYVEGGGAIDNVAADLPSAAVTATINNCTFIGNVVSGSAGVDGDGGALFNYGLNAIMTVSSSTLAGNKAVGGDGGAGTNGGNGVGGGIDNAGILDLSNSTLETNTAEGGKGGNGANGGNGQGGGLAIQAGSSSIVSASTITHNQADGGPEGAGGSNGQGVGGGVYNLGTFIFDTLTVIKGNHASTSNDDFYP